VADDDAVITVASTTDEQAALESSLQDDERAARVPVEDSSLSEFKTSEFENGNVKSLSYEAENSSRQRYLRHQARVEKELAELSTPAEPEEKAPTEARVPVSPTQPSLQPQETMVPASRVADVVEQQILVREHHQRLAAAMQNPEYAQAMAAIDPDTVNVSWDPAIGAALCAQPNSAMLVWFLSARPDVAQQIASMTPVRGVAEMSKLASWLETQMRPPNTSAQRPAPPAPIKPLSGAMTRSSVPTGEMSYQDFKRQREAEIRARRGNGR